MKQVETKTGTIAYKWVSYGALLLFLVFWFFTFGLMYFKKTADKINPYINVAYKTFWRPNWRLFARTKLYNRQLNVILYDSSRAARDTLDLVQHSLYLKRKYAPFNNYEEGLDRYLYVVMNNIEAALTKKKVMLRKEFPGNTEEWYVLKASQQLAEDNRETRDLKNLETYVMRMLLDKEINTGGKQYQLQMTYKFIPPQHPPAGNFNRGNATVIFQTGYTAFK